MKQRYAIWWVQSNDHTDVYRYERRVDELSENYNKGILKSVKNTITEKKKHNITGNQQEIQKCIRMDQQSGNQGNGKYHSRTAWNK